MVRLVKGYAGTGKTKKVLEDVYALIDADEINTENILLLTLTPTEKNELVALNQNVRDSKNITIWAFDNLLSYLLKKSPSSFETKTISDFLAIHLIGSICKKEFAQNSALMNLTKSNTFFRELYNLFGLLKNNEISHDHLNIVMAKIKISSIDKGRLELIFKVFEQYDKKLKANKYLDYRDVVLESAKALISNKLLLETIKSKFSYIFIDGLEDITYLQYKLIKLISNPNNLYLYGDEYSRIQEFRGAWRDSLIEDALKSDFGTIEVNELADSKRNNEILERALYLVKKYNSEAVSFDFDKVESIKYKTLEDVQGEFSNLAKDILDKVKNEGCEFSDFAILIRDYEAKQKIIDLFKSQGIPINSELYNQDYQNFIFKLTRYLSICEVLEKLGIKTFDKLGISSTELKSKTDKEILFEELNLYIENILSESLDDNYAKERFVSLQEEYKNISLLDVVYKKLDLLKELDKKKLIDEFLKISEIYESYKNNKIIDLIVFIAKSEAEVFGNNEFNSIFAKLLSKVSEVSDLYKNVLKEKLELNVVRDVISIPFEDRLSSSNSVNLLTFFKSAGLEFKHVYIPSLSEKTFPKKVKSTYFISHESNEIISAELKKLNPNFKHLIELDKDSIEEEARLFYLGMTRAKSSLTISTHKWEDKKQIQPSVFYQMLVDVDKENYEEIGSAQYDNESFEIKEEVAELSQKSAVIEEGSVLKLNPSAISNFLSCPKKYYCKNLLNLKEESVFAANYGTIVHAILEVFVKNHLNNYTKETILELGEILFAAKVETQKAIDEGFKPMDIDKVIATDELNLAEMKENFADAVVQLNLNNFFEQEFIPSDALTEKGFTFTIEDLPNVEFDGRIDTICKFEDGYKIIDYKTGKNKKKKLSYYVSEYGVNFEGDYGQYKGVYNENNISTYEYQIPIYYLASKNAESLKDFKDEIAELGLLYVRPKSQEDGYKKDFLSAQQIEEQTERIIQNLKTTVIDEILEKDTFEPKKDYMTCKNCTYNFLCDESEDSDDDN